MPALGRCYASFVQTPPRDPTRIEALRAPRRTVGWLVGRILTVVFLSISAILVIFGGVLLVPNVDPASMPARVAAGVGVDTIILGVVMGALTLYAAWPLDKRKSQNAPPRDGPYR
jgi:hypothetical protein